VKGGGGGNGPSEHATKELGGGGEASPSM
jgi:hypothetical protein